jgi:hypothetical protein
MIISFAKNVKSMIMKVIVTVVINNIYILLF